jgi:hypothetical protein
MLPLDEVDNSRETPHITNCVPLQCVPSPSKSGSHGDELDQVPLYPEGGCRLAGTFATQGGLAKFAMVMWLIHGLPHQFFIPNLRIERGHTTRWVTREKRETEKYIFT